MLWIAVYLPQLPLDLAWRRWPEAMRDGLRQTLPLAVAEARRIGWASEAAQAAGIQPGMPESAARARLHELVLLARAPQAEADAIVEAALWALHFTPQVSLQEAGLLLDVTASLRLFGGLRALAQRLRAGVAALGFTPQLASAPTASAAMLFARRKDDVHAQPHNLAAWLDRLPVDFLHSAAGHEETLRGIGIARIGELRRLPRGGITRRFGSAMLAELDRALGDEPEAFDWYQPPERFRLRRELGARIEDTEGILHEARRMLMQMTGWLVARHAAVRAFSLLLHHEPLRARDKRSTTVAITLGSASRDLAHLTLLLQERLAQLALDGSVIELELLASEIEQLAAPNTELFPAPASQAESLVRLVERLAARLGETAIARLALAADHRPERSTTLLPPHGSLPRTRDAVPLHAFGARPVWLLPEPLALVVRDERPLYQGPLALLAGPERIESGWWDDALALRDYFIAANGGGRFLWIYRERMGAGREEAGWFLQGYFA